MEGNSRLLRATLRAAPWFIPRLCLPVRWHHRAGVLGALGRVRAVGWVLSGEGTPAHSWARLRQGCCVWNAIIIHTRTGDKWFPRVWQRNKSRYVMVTLLWWYNFIVPKRLCLRTHACSSAAYFYLQPKRNTRKTVSLKSSSLFLACVMTEALPVISVLGWCETVIGINRRGFLWKVPPDFLTASLQIWYAVMFLVLFITVSSWRCWEGRDEGLESKNE